MLMALQRQGGPYVYSDPLDLENIVTVNGLIETPGVVSPLMQRGLVAEVGLLAGR